MFGTSWLPTAREGGEEMEIMPPIEETGCEPLQIRQHHNEQKAHFSSIINVCAVDHAAQCTRKYATASPFRRWVHPNMHRVSAMQVDEVKSCGYSLGRDDVERMRREPFIGPLLSFLPIPQWKLKFRSHRSAQCILQVIIA